VANVDKAIKYPSSEEKSGRISLARRLPFKLWENVAAVHALKLLGAYMTSTSVSPLMEAFVEIPDPYATDVALDVLLFSDPSFTIDFDNVPLDKMEKVEPLLDQVIATILADGPDKFDLGRMHTLSKSSFNMCVLTS
jgi:Zn-dependent M16 (insulinase) family peptidase